MWVKPAPRHVRDYRTKQLLDPSIGTLVDDNDIGFAQLLNHGDVVQCQEDGSPLPSEEADLAPAEAAPQAAPAAPIVKPDKSAPASAGGAEVVA